MRMDIQALRALAILLVLFHHAGIGPLQAGYLGVDVFFVISGFLITGMVKKALEKGSFSFSEFYFRRAKRLLPAAYATFLVTAIAAPLFLNARELHDFIGQVLGAVTFTGNIVLWQQAGYFEGPAELKPLLHVWSLSIEEQYYLILPALLFFVDRKYWLHGAVVVLVASLALALVMQPIKPIATFYLLPTRAWELGIGSLAAILSLQERIAYSRFRPLLFWLGLLLIVIIPVWPLSNAHPGIDAVIVCLATLAVIVSNQTRYDQTMPMSVLKKMGDMSYSLYLVHWPMFAFLNNAYVGEPDLTSRLSVLLLSLIAAYGLHKYIEAPLHRMEFEPRVRRHFFRLAGASSLSLVALPFGLSHANANDRDYSYVFRINQGLSKACEYTEDFAPKEECRTSDAPTLLVWGDSFAMHLVPGIAKQWTAGMEQATRSSCGPILGLAFEREPKYSRQWARECIAFNDSVFDYLAASRSIQTVVLSSPFKQYLPSKNDAEDRKSVFITNGVVQVRPASYARAVSYFTATLRRIKALGKHVVVVSPPPSGGFNISQCLERKDSGKMVFGVRSDCVISLASYEKYRGDVMSLLSRVTKDIGVELVRLDKYLCTDQGCITQQAGTFIYRDKGHLSYDGSILLSEKVHWADLIRSDSPG